MEGEHDGEGVFEGRFLDNLPARDVEHLLLADLRLVVEAALALARGVVFDFRVRVAGRGGGAEGGGFLGADFAGDLDDVTGDAVLGEVLLGGEVAVAPLAGGGVGADQQEGDGGGDDDDEGDNEGDSPRLVRGEARVVDKRVEDCGHQEVCDTTSGVAEACGEGVARANHVLIEESSRPYLAGHKATPEDTDEEPESHETFGVGDGTGKHCGYGASQQAACEGVSGAVEIAHRSSD